MADALAPLPRLPALPKWPDPPCSIRDCKGRATRYSPMCRDHRRAVQRLGHPLARNLPSRTIREYEKRVRYGLLRLPKGTRGEIEENVRRAVGALLAHCAAFASGEAYGELPRAPTPKARASLQRTAVKAARALLDPLTAVDPQLIGLRVAALVLLYRREPKVFQSSDECYGATLLHATRKLGVLATRWRARNPGEPRRSRCWYNPLPLHARRLAQGWLVDALIPSAIVLVRAAVEAERLIAAEHTRARALAAEVGVSFERALARVQSQTRKARKPTSTAHL
jgi:hypothetical protein